MAAIVPREILTGHVVCIVIYRQTTCNKRSCKLRHIVQAIYGVEKHAQMCLQARSYGAVRSRRSDHVEWDRSADDKVITSLTK